MAWAADVAGNVQGSPASVTFTSDNTAPETTATLSGQPGDNGWYTGVVTVSLSAVDATSGVVATRYRIDGGPWQRAYLVGNPGHEGYEWQRWGYDLGAWAAGEHTVTSRAIDRAGNVQPAPEDPVIANKLTFWESNGQITRTVIIP